MQSFSLAREGQPTLRYALFESKRQPTCGRVLLTPGFAEHVGRYVHVAEAWARAGLVVAVHDPRGQGDSGGRRAFVERFDEYVEDARAVLEVLETKAPWNEAGPTLLFGHSMGALITMFLALSSPTRFRGVALSSPFFAQALPTPGWKKMLGRWMSGVWPTYADKTGIVGVMVTHDQERARWMDEDPKRLFRVTARWFTEIEAAQRRLRDRAPEFRLPIFCVAAGEDKISCVRTTREIFAKLSSPEKELRIAEGQYHELHQEVRRAEFIEQFAERFLSWADPAGAANAASGQSLETTE